MAWHSVADAGALREDEAKGLIIDGHAIALCLVDGAYYALENICTHQFALMSDGLIEGGCIECPLHQGRFEIKTGKAIGLPATIDLKTYPVKVEAGTVMVFIEPTLEERNGIRSNFEQP